MHQFPHKNFQVKINCIPQQYSAPSDLSWIVTTLSTMFRPTTHIDNPHFTVELSDE